MPDIQLRDYTAKIKALIRDIRLDEAIVHCQQILRHYPKHIETYCLLGEACLEKELYREAIEFFQRTLSADPENLIARVGLGVIYDEQGAVPEATWQLERAFELAPGNAEVRRELQRLYSQHSGAERSRLKLTRGALGRLYSRNGLYERAIDEFQAVLRQDPDLPDVRVALVEALWHEGRRVEAVEACLEVLEALPYCLKANLILGEIWVRGGNEEAGEEKLEVARALDPENLVAQAVMGSDSPLPVEEVFLPELKAMPPEFEAAVPAEVPMVFPGALAEAEAWPAEEEGLPLERVPPEEEEEIPDWLRDLEMEVQEEPPPEMEAEEAVLATVQPEEEAPAEELPEWLQELMGEEVPVPAEEPVGLDEVVEAEEVWPGEEPAEWLPELEEEGEEVAALPPAEAPPVEAVVEGEVPVGVLAAAAALLYEEKRERAEAEVEAEELEGEEAEEAPEWVQAMATEAPEAFEEAERRPAEEEMELAEEIPPWIEEYEPVEMEEEALLTVADVEEAAVPEVEVPASLIALVEAGLLEESDLKAAMGEMSAEELEMQRAEDVPTWLQELIGEEEGIALEEAKLPEEVLLVAEELAPVEEEVPPAEELPEWLLAFEASEEEAARPPAEVVEEEVPLVEEEVFEPVAEVVEEEVLPVEEEVFEPVAEVVEEEVLPVEEEVFEPVAEVVEEEVLPVEEEVFEPVAEVVEEEVLPVEEEVFEPVTEVAEEEVPLVEEEVFEPVAEVVEEEVLPVEEEVFEPVAEVVEEEVPLVEEVFEPVAEVVEEGVLPVEEEVFEPVAEVVEEEVPLVEEEVFEPVAEVVEEEVLPVEEVVVSSRVDALAEQLKAQPRSYGVRLELARAYGADQDWSAALVQYEKLVSARKFLPEVLEDLQPLADKDVDRTRLYQLMGDIYMQQNQLDDALKMYRQARRTLARS